MCSTDDIEIGWAESIGMDCYPVGYKDGLELDESVKPVMIGKHVSGW